MVNENAVFINMPYAAGKYERLFVSYIAAIISIGRTPRCTIEFAERGQGRLQRICDMLENCRVSVHDLSFITTPVRFNMPFELGLACAISKYRGPHDYILLDSEIYRLDRHLSDTKGCDPYIHNGTMFGVVKCILDALGQPEGHPEVTRVHKMAKDLLQIAKQIKKKNRITHIFTRSLFHQLVIAGVELSVQRGFIPAND